MLIVVYVMVMKVIETTASGFEEIITKGNLYVDKTEYFYDLITGPKMVFFSRPRRFGKSMTVSTLKAIFEGLILIHMKEILINT